MSKIIFQTKAFKNKTAWFNSFLDNALQMEWQWQEQMQRELITPQFCGHFRKEKKCKHNTFLSDLKQRNMKCNLSNCHLCLFECRLCRAIWHFTLYFQWASRYVRHQCCWGSIRLGKHINAIQKEEALQNHFCSKEIFKWCNQINLFIICRNGLIQDPLLYDIIDMYFHSKGITLPLC